MTTILENRNVKDEYSAWTNDLINEHLDKHKRFPAAALAMQVKQDFNVGSLIRSANSFGIGKTFYYGPRKHIDRRGTVGAHWTIPVKHLREIEQVKELKKQYVFVGLENNIKDKKINRLQDFKFPRNSLIIVGEECGGISEDVLPLVDHFVEIESYGAVRSVNAACAASVAFYEYTRQYTYMSLWQKLKIKLLGY
jgi:tRNA G18 (ribose-2'-O)-methylase SpoU